jgi:tRNA (mo5U34)-methyltransferase
MGKTSEFCAGLWRRPDLLGFYPEIMLSELSEQRSDIWRKLSREHWQGLRDDASNLSDYLNSEFRLEFTDGVVSLENPGPSCGELSRIADKIVDRLKPWRKGPFLLNGSKIESEWRSDFKWERVAPYLKNVEGKRIADVGCGNGYTIFRLDEQSPECIIGFDPGEISFFQFELIQLFAKRRHLQIELLRDSALRAFEQFFDIVLCMGVLYHHRDPLGLLRNLRSSIRSGGQLILESQTYPMKGNFCFFNPDRYAKAHNVYFVPTSECLSAMLRKVGFKEVVCVSEVEITTEEQRSTEHMKFESLADFLDPKDPSRTVEGHLAPTRSIITAQVP